MRWEDTDERTVMHMLGYGPTNVWDVSIFREAINHHDCEWPTLLFLADYYVRIWGRNDDINKVIEYLEGLRYDEVRQREEE